METELISIMQSIFNFFYSPWTKGICCIFLIISAIGLWFGRSQNGGIFKVFVPIMCGTVLFMCAGTLAIGIGKMHGYDLSEKIKVPTVSAAARRSRISSAVSTGSAATSSGDETTDSGSSSGSASSETSSDGGGSSKELENVLNAMAVTKKYDEEMEKATNTKDKTNAFNSLLKESIVTHNAAVTAIESYGTKTGYIRQTGTSGYFEGDTYIVDGTDYLVDKSGNIYTSMNKNYSYDENGNLVEISTKEQMEKTMQAMKEDRTSEYAWQLLKSSD